MRISWACLALLLASCGSFMETQEPGPAGLAEIRISLGRFGQPLAKVATAAGKNDTLITLDSLHLVLTSPGMATQTRTLMVVGNINTGSITMAVQSFNLYSLRNWQVKAWTDDNNDSVVHLDSTTFYVNPADTAIVSLPLNPRYSVVIARFVSTSTTVTAIEKLELRVNGSVVDDTVFKPKLKTFNVKLSNKYLKVGASATIILNALDRASPARVKYTKTVTLTPTASRDSSINIQLN